MRRVNSVVRKLGIVVIAIVTLVVAATGLVNNIIGNHYALESARAMLHFNSESILGGIEKLMMTRNNDGVSDLIHDISKGSEVYQDIRLVDHYSGEIVVSRLHETGAILGEEDRSCSICHEETEPLVTSADPRDEVIAGPDGTGILHVITPIMNRAGCKNAECHEHLDSGPTLGFLHTEYSLERVDSLISGLNTSFVVAALAAILLGTMALWIMFERTLSRPIRYMLSGIQAVAGNDLSFRFKTNRRDEFGLVEESFDHMAARIQAHQTELRDAREYLEGIVENSADLIITVNPQGLIQTVNRGAEQALGYRREELIGQRIERLFADPRERDIAITKLLQSGDDVTNYETRFLTKDKNVRYVLLTLSRLRDREGSRHRNDRHQQGHHEGEGSPDPVGPLGKGRGHRSGRNGDSACHQEHAEHADGRLLSGAQRDLEERRAASGRRARDDRRRQVENREPLVEHAEIRQGVEARARSHRPRSDRRRRLQGHHAGSQQRRTRRFVTTSPITCLRCLAIHG